MLVSDDGLARIRRICHSLAAGGADLLIWAMLLLLIAWAAVGCLGIHGAVEVLLDLLLGRGGGGGLLRWCRAAVVA